MFFNFMMSETLEQKLSRKQLLSKWKRELTKKAVLTTLVIFCSQPVYHSHCQVLTFSLLWQSQKQFKTLLTSQLSCTIIWFLLVKTGINQYFRCWIPKNPLEAARNRYELHCRAWWSHHTFPAKCPSQCTPLKAQHLRGPILVEKTRETLINAQTVQ